MNSVGATGGKGVGIRSADEAMCRYANGEASAFEIVYDHVAPRLEGFLRRRVRDTEVMKDIIQQTFFQMHSAREAFIPHSAVLPWAYAIAGRLLIDWRRKGGREQQCCDPDAHNSGPPFSLATAVGNGEETLSAREMAARLSVAYRQLTDDQRAAFDLVTQQELSHAEAARILGTTVMAIKLRMHRSYLLLRAAVTDEGLLLGGGRR